MKIAIVGFGKMGHIIKNIAETRGHEVVSTVDVIAEDASCRIAKGDTASLVRAIKSCGAEGIIEFSHPSSVVENLKALVPLGIPIVVGTTGWKESEAEIANVVSSCAGVLMRSSNFSVGVNLFFKIVSEATKLISEYGEYDVAVWEAHHNQKADSPSGTALEIARRILESCPHKNKIVEDAFHEKPQNGELHVSSTRIGSMHGTHTVFFDSPADTIELTHRARNRDGLASGAVTALERLVEKTKTGALSRGKIYGMEDLF